MPLNRDVLWYKDAIIYQVHVRTFHDSNGDGIGDFPGLEEKLDYLQELGTSAIWLMPFFPSPLRDDGYDIADYNAVHSSYGTLEDFRKFLGSAHDRGIRIIIEMVSNHTSDQHPWFQESRSYDAKFDGKDYPIQGDPGHTTVSLKRIGDDTIEETDKRDGKIVGVYRMTVSSDGKSIHAEYTDKERGTSTTFTMEKQS